MNKETFDICFFIFAIVSFGLYFGYCIYSYKRPSKPESWFWANSKYCTDEEWKTRYTIYDDIEYILCLIPETGLNGHYCGQGDARWAWVRKDIYDKM